MQRAVAINYYARGVATVTVDTSDEELMEVRLAGVRRVRFDFLKHLLDFIYCETFERFAHRIVSLRIAHLMTNMEENIMIKERRK